MPSLLSIMERQRRFSDGAYLWLLEIELPYGETVRLARNTENVEWPAGSGTVWPKFWFDFDDIQEGGGETQEVVLRVSNVGGAMLRYCEMLEDYRKTHGREPVPLRLVSVNSKLLDQEEPEAELYFEEHGIEIPPPMQFVLITIGADRLFGKVFPRRPILPTFCGWTTTEECPYAGVCDHTLTTCRSTYARSEYFGGFPVTGIAGAYE